MNIILQIKSEVFYLLLCNIVGLTSTEDPEILSYDYSWDEVECPDPESPGFILDLIYASNKIAIGAPYRAYRTAPDGWIKLDESTIPGAGLGAFATTFIPRYTWLGEFDGDIIPLNETVEIEGYNLDYAWEVTKSGELSFHVDAQFENSSNWLRYVNCARHISEENIIPTFCYGRVFYLTSRDIPPSTELLVYYGDSYAEELDIDVDNYDNLDVMPSL